MEDRNATNAQIWESTKARIMMATAPHVTSGSGLKNFRPMDLCSTECTFTPYRD